MRRSLTLADASIRETAIRWIREAPDRTRVEFREPRRTLPQNARLWAMLADVSRQVEHCGRRYSPEEWKAIFMHALGREIQFVPSLDGNSIIPLGLSSSDLSKSEMSDLIESMFAFGAERGICWTDPTLAMEVA